MSKRKRALQPEDLATELRRLEDKNSKDLKALWLEWFGKPPPLRLRRHTLSLGIAYQLQSRSIGALSKTSARALEAISASEFGETGSDKPTQSLKLKPGTKLVRERHGVVYEVTVIKDGFVWRGDVYKSLTAVARAITGTNWNGYVFFGLKKNGPPKPKQISSSNSKEASISD